MARLRALIVALVACSSPEPAVPCVTEQVWIDRDLDGWGDPETEDLLCGAPDGYARTPGDCDDGDARVFPAAEEVCDGLDQDCDGVVDEDLQRIWYLDRDSDGAGDDDTSWEGCLAREGVSAVQFGGDCDDWRPEVFPGADEVCDGVDQDCDGLVDEDAVDAPTWFLDEDGDAWGGDIPGVTACDEPLGHARTDTDCDDAEPYVFPGAEELVDGLDNDCDGVVDG